VTGLGRFLRAASIPAVFALLALALASPAGAAYQRPFEETFGSAEQPTFASPATLAVDPATGDLLVGDSSNGTIKRFHADGTPDPFAALGSNTIDGKEDAKPCAEEPASCDKTPQNGIKLRTQSEGTQIAVDHSGGATDGNIYLTQESQNLVDIFSSKGRYLGQLTGANYPSLGFKNFEGPCGVAVDSSGAVYVSGRAPFTGQRHPEAINKFVPSGNPPVNSDNTVTFSTPSGYGNCGLAAGAGPTTGWLFVAINNGQQGIPDESISKINAETGELQYSFAEGQGLTGAAVVDPSSGRLVVVGKDGFVGAQRGGEALEFDVSGSSGAVQTARLVDNVNPMQGIAADNSGRIYITSPTGNVKTYGPPGLVPTVTASPASASGTKATLAGTVNPEGLEVTKCVFQYGPTTSYGEEAPCEGSIPTDSANHPVHLNVAGLQPDGHTYHFRLVASNANGTEESADQTFVTAQTTVTEAASGLGPETATLNGTVRPEGRQYTECVFEYGISTNAGFEKTASCQPSAADIASDFSPHTVKAPLEGLQAATTYKFRLTTTTSEGTLSGKTLTFATSGPPLISEVRGLDATQSSATIEGKVNPSGFGTSYRFEWGPTNSYGNQAPAEFEPYLGEVNKPIRVSAKLTGLPSGATYHYRIVATSSAGITASADQTLETLNSCGLPEERCFELVSRREAGPVAIPGESIAALEPHYQAATEGPGGLAYSVEAGYPESTKGAEVLYRGTRGPSGWKSTQLSTPILALNEQTGGESGTGSVKWLSHELSCGFAESTQPLTDDPATRLAREYGGANLYRTNPDGSYTAVSNLAPENPEELAGTGYNYLVAGASQDCSKVLFESHYHYPGVSGVGQARLYEWDEGTLHNVGVVPGPSGEVIVSAGPGTGSSANTQNTVSEDGSRVFFSAERKTSPNPAEIGKVGLFVREDGTTSRDLSLSETSTPDEGATYQWATPDGSKVFFTANAGLTDESSSEGPDLYVYDLESEKLTDLTAYQGVGGARVAGFVGASEDGSHVYFASPNQLLPGRGSTLAENQGNKTLSIYGEANGEFHFVGTFSNADRVHVVLGSQLEWTSRVSPDGRYLLFESSADVTGYDSGGPAEAYLYDAHGGSEGTTCVSCRQDGQPSVAPLSYHLLAAGQAINNALNGPQFLTVHGGQPQVFFSSPDKLAPGAVENQNNVYEWSHGQVFRVVSARKGQQSPVPGAGFGAFFSGASDDGSNAYFVTPETLNWEDGDERLSVYDARVGGGFPEPAAQPPPCEATTEGSCQGAAQGAPAVGGAASAAFNGPGNPPAQAPKQKKSKKPHKKKHKHAKKKNNSKARQANANRRAGK
jgi:Tol biopolymer transport system component